MKKTALIREPAARLDEGIVTHVARRPVDVRIAREQWSAYTECLHTAGWTTVEVPPAPDCADGVFVEDTMVAYRNVAVVARSGAPARRPEIEAVEPIVRSLGMSVFRIESPGTLDGGDVLKIDDLVYVGCGGRTNAEGIRQLRAAVEPVGARVIAVPVTKVLHLKSAVTALPDGTVIGYEPLVDDTRMFPMFRPVPEESGAHVVLLGHDRLLMSADCPRTGSMLASLGYQTVHVDISEFQKLEGCVTCLSVRLRSLAR